MPVMREIGFHSPEQNLVPFLSFITAADALHALDRLGPAAGLDISAEIVWGMKDPILGYLLPVMKRNFPKAPVTET